VNQAVFCAVVTGSGEEMAWLWLWAPLSSLSSWLVFSRLGLCGSPFSVIFLV
jgi:hypothetical protein